MPLRPAARPLSSEDLYPARDPSVRARFLSLGHGERVRVAEAGADDGDPVLMLNGWGASVFNYRLVLPRLAEDGYRGIALDIRGHGLSDASGDASQYTSEALTEQVVSVLDALQLRSAVLVGQSMAGAAVLDTVWRVPERVRGAVLLAPIGFAHIARVTAARLLRVRQWHPRRVPRWVVELILRRVYGVRASFTERDVDEYWATLQAPATVTALMLLVERFDWTPRPPRACPPGTPLHVLFGERDRLIPAARAAARARRFTGALVEVIEGAGHLLAEEVPGEVVRAIESGGGGGAARAPPAPARPATTPTR
jgi:pimeloyl-ACP methyl ester carboxylesterase